MQVLRDMKSMHYLPSEARVHNAVTKDNAYLVSSLLSCCDYLAQRLLLIKDLGRSVGLKST